MNRSFCILLASLGIGILTGCNKPKSTAEAYVVRVGDSTISPEAWKRELQKHPNFTSEQRETMLQDMIRNEALYARARKTGFDKDPEIEQRVKRLVATAYLEKLQGPEGRKTNSIDDLKEYYAAHTNEFSVGERVHLAGIFLRVSPKATEEKKKEAMDEANRILARAQSTQNSSAAFGDLAREVSEDQSTRYKGGDLGWFTRSEAVNVWGAPVADAIFALKEARDLSRPIETPGGIYIFKLIERQPSHVKTLDEVKELVAFRVTREKEARAAKELDEKVKAGLNIEINRPLIDQIAGSVTNLAAPPPSMPVQ